MPRSIRFYLHNRWNGSSSTISSSGEQTNYEASQTKTLALFETWRSTGLAGAFISADLGSSLDIGAVCIVGTNLTKDATIRVRVSTVSNFSTTLYDSGFVTRFRYYSDTEISRAGTSEFFPGGLPIDGIERRIQRQVLIFELPSEVTARYVRVDFNDSGNTNGYIEVGYIYAGKVLQPPRDLLYGWKIQRDDIVRGGQAACGQYWSADVFSKTLIALQMAPQIESDITGYWMLLESLVGINCELIISLIDKNDSLKYTTSVYGKFNESFGNQSLAFLHWGISMQFEEIID